ncbi:unnamed protein product [Pleuronectes platessa]|uniref:Uncharacterized protein n=1 Tax=Pleuronectes platessa TaxID=8262 RepID=A0A9N7TP98_PLEPL|nr:unnamed protein product [Pleuronectes platessa]
MSLAPSASSDPPEHHGDLGATSRPGATVSRRRVTVCPLTGAAASCHPLQKPTPRKDFTSSANQLRRSTEQRRLLVQWLSLVATANQKFPSFRSSRVKMEGTEGTVHFHIKLYKNSHYVFARAVARAKSSSLLAENMHIAARARARRRGYPAASCRCEKPGNATGIPRRRRAQINERSAERSVPVCSCRQTPEKHTDRREDCCGKRWTCTDSLAASMDDQARIMQSIGGVSLAGHSVQGGMVLPPHGHDGSDGDGRKQDIGGVHMGRQSVHRRAEALCSKTMSERGLCLQMSFAVLSVLGLFYPADYSLVLLSCLGSEARSSRGGGSGKNNKGERLPPYGISDQKKRGSVAGLVFDVQGGGLER